MIIRIIEDNLDDLQRITEHVERFKLPTEAVEPVTDLNDVYARTSAGEMDWEHVALILDIEWTGRHDGRNLLELLNAQRHLDIHCFVLAISRHEEYRDQVQELGAWYYLTKKQADEELRVQKFLEYVRSRLDNEYYRRGVFARCGLVGDSAAVEELRQKIVKIASTDWSVLLSGQNGSGKTTVAHAIYALSKRSSGRLVERNSTDVTSEHIAASLPGTVNVGFPRGRLFRAAAGGTLLLEEISRLSGEAQAKLLTVLKTGFYYPVDADEPAALDTRIISTNTGNIHDAVLDGSLSGSLFQLLAVLPVAVPPLVERLDDLPELVRHFAEDDNLRIDNAALKKMRAYPWPGNLSELRNFVVQLGVFFPDADSITYEMVADLGEAQSRIMAHSETLPLEAYLAQREREYILAALRQANGVRVRAAQILDVSRATFYVKLRKHGIPVDAD